MADNAPIDMGSFVDQNGQIGENPTPLFRGASTTMPAAPPKAFMVQPDPKYQEKSGFQDQTVLHGEQPSISPVEAYKEGSLGSRPTRWEQFVAKVKEASMSSPIGFYNNYEGSLARMLEEGLAENLQASKGINKLTPEQANMQYPGLPQPFKEDIYPEVARLRWEAHQRRQELEGWAAAGDNQLGTLSNLAAGATSMVDPLNLALNYATAGLMRVGGLATKGLAGIRNTFLSNLAINTAGEIPNYIQTAREGDNVSLGESATQVVGGALGGTAIHGFIQGVGKLLHIGAESIGITSEASKVAGLKTAILQHEMGSKVDLSAQAGVQALRQAGHVAAGGSDPYVFQQIAHPSERSYFAASAASSGEHIPLNDLGVGVYGSDHGQVANNLASEPEGVYTGRIDEFRVPKESPFLDLETPAASKEGAGFVKALEEKTGIKITLPENATLKDALTLFGQEADSKGVKPEALADAQAIAQAQGYQGYKYLGTGSSGADNRVLMFPGSEGEHVQAYDANKATTPQMDSTAFQEQMGKAGSPQTSVLADPEVDQTLAVRKATPVPDPKILDPVIAQQAAEAQRLLKEFAAEDPELHEELQNLNREKATDAQTKKMAEAVADCMSKSVT